jgi:hypothetical protein
MKYVRERVGLWSTRTLRPASRAVLASVAIWRKRERLPRTEYPSLEERTGQLQRARPAVARVGTHAACAPRTCSRSRHAPQARVCVGFVPGGERRISAPEQVFPVLTCVADRCVPWHGRGRVSSGSRISESSPRRPARFMSRAYSLSRESSQSRQQERPACAARTRSGPYVLRSRDAPRCTRESGVRPCSSSRAASCLSGLALSRVVERARPLPSISIRQPRSPGTTWTSPFAMCVNVPSLELTKRRESGVRSEAAGDASQSPMHPSAPRLARQSLPG